MGKRANKTGSSLVLGVGKWRARGGQRSAFIAGWTHCCPWAPQPTVNTEKASGCVPRALIVCFCLICYSTYWSKIVFERISIRSTYLIVKWCNHLANCIITFTLLGQVWIKWGFQEERRRRLVLEGCVKVHGNDERVGYKLCLTCPSPVSLPQILFLSLFLPPPPPHHVSPSHRQ
jgi:hypothetical protein